MIPYFIKKINWICLSIDCKAIHVFRACTLSETAVVSEKKTHIYISNPGGKMTHCCAVNEVKIKEKETRHSCMCSSALII